MLKGHLWLHHAQSKPRALLPAVLAEHQTPITGLIPVARSEQSRGFCEISYRCVSGHLFCCGQGWLVAPDEDGEGAGDEELETWERGTNSLCPRWAGTAGWTVPSQTAPCLLLLAGLLMCEAS